MEKYFVRHQFTEMKFAKLSHSMPEPTLTRVAMVDQTRESNILASISYQPIIVKSTTCISASISNLNYIYCAPFDAITLKEQRDV